MYIFNIMISFFILAFILLIVILLVRLFSGHKSFSEASFNIAISWDDLIRQLLLGFSCIIVITALYTGIHSLGLNIGWYCFTVIGGIITTLIGYRQNSPITFVTGLIMFTTGVAVGGYEVASNNNIDRGLAYMSAFLILTSFYGLAVIFLDNQRSKRYYIALNLLAILGLGILIFFLGSFGAREAWGYIANSEYLDIWSNIKTILITIGVLILLIISYFRSINYFKVKPYQIIISLIGIAVAILVIILPNVSLLYDSQMPISYSELDWAQKNLEILPHIISMNILFLILVLWLLYSAYKLKEIWRLNLSILALFIFILVRYFDWVERTELDRSLFFLSLGVIFLFTGWVLERVRRNILASIDN